MRKKKTKTFSGYKIMVVDDDIGVVDSLSVIFKRSGYDCVGFTNPLEAIEKLGTEGCDLLILDFLMKPIYGDKVVEKIRTFNTELYILLLTGHKDMVPPLETIRTLDIQGYCEKSDRFDQLLLLVESGIKSITQMRTIKKFRDGLNAILEAVPRIYELQHVDDALEDILTEIMPVANSENAFILIDDFTDTSNENGSFYRGIGKYSLEVGSFVEMLSPEFMENIGHARANKQLLRCDDGIILPLISINSHMPSMGVIYIEGDDIDEYKKLMEIYANQAASALNNAFLLSLVNTKNEELNKTYQQLKVSYMDTIEALRQAVDARDVYTRGHSDRVAHFAVAIGKAFALSEEELEKLRISGIFHDVGKIGTTDDILLKTNKLNEKEYAEIKKHPLKGAHMLSAVSMFKDVVPLVKHHHERYDGSGYPDRLKGDNIPLLARILSVADAFDAMMSDRLYRTKLSLEDAKQQLVDGAGTQFDGKVVDKLLYLLQDYEQILGEIAFTDNTET